MSSIALMMNLSGICIYAIPTWSYPHFFIGQVGPFIKEHFADIKRCKISQQPTNSSQIIAF